MTLSTAGNRAGDQRRPAGGQPVPSPAGLIAIPAGQSGHDSAKHRGVGLKGSSIANGEWKDGECRNGQESRAPSLTGACQLEEPPGRQHRRQGRQDAPRFLQADTGRSFQGDDTALVEWRLDHKVIGKRRRIELRAEQPRAPFQVARHHRRRDLSPHVVLDDRLAGVKCPNQKCQEQKKAKKEHAPCSRRQANEIEEGRFSAASDSSLCLPRTRARELLSQDEIVHDF